MKYLLPLVAFAALAAALLAVSGCKTSPDFGDNWPYKGPPMVGTNSIPAPHWEAK